MHLTTPRTTFHAPYRAITWAAYRASATAAADPLRRMGVLAVALCSLFILSACVGGKQPQTRFYVLDAMPAGEPALAGATRTPPLAVDIAALRLPQYLERPQIVTRAANNELKLDDYHQWGGNLAKNMMRITAQNLARLLDTARITIFSRRPSQAPDVRVEIDVLQFERGPDARVLLSAQWRIVAGNEGRSQIARISELYSEPVAATAPIEETVRIMSELVGKLDREIAVAIIASNP